ncbi:nucleoside-diphosphate kinase [bacterium]|nr:nucleoside-diphosphate kinase [bacterium]
MERTFIAVKPDGVKRGLIGEVLKRFEMRGYKIIGLKMLQVTPEQAAAHYAEHVGKPFYDGLVKFITAAPVVAIALEGEDVVAQARRIMGATDPNKAEIGTIRADFGQAMNRNIVHGSDSVESANRELAIYFKSEELMSGAKNSFDYVIESLL